MHRPNEKVGFVLLDHPGFEPRPEFGFPAITVFALPRVRDQQP
jgi:hypothetical protein